MRTDRAEIITRIRELKGETFETVLEIGGLLNEGQFRRADYADLGLPFLTYEHGRKYINVATSDWITNPEYRRYMPDGIKALHQIYLCTPNGWRSNLFIAGIERGIIHRNAAWYDIEAWRTLMRLPGKTEPGCVIPALRADQHQRIICGDCLDLVPQLADRSIGAVVTSPPYAEQRQEQYQGVPEDQYPGWFCSLMDALYPKLSDNGSVLVVIRSHISNGRLSDYVMRTRLAVRDAGWIESEELIWHKPDAPPLGSVNRPRRNFENILWFSKSEQPYVDLTACGNASTRLGHVGSDRFDTEIVKGFSDGLDSGTSRVTDVFKANVCEIEDGVMHPAMFPLSLARQLILTFSRPGSIILDPFVGSGTTALVARLEGRDFIGFDIDQRYVEIANDRLEHDLKDQVA